MGTLEAGCDLAQVIVVEKSPKFWAKICFADSEVEGRLREILGGFWSFRRRTFGRGGVYPCPPLIVLLEDSGTDFLGAVLGSEWGRALKF